MASMRLFTLLLVALLVIAVVPREAQVEGAVNVDVPVLTKSVVLDGQVTFPDEWSDTPEAEVTFPQRWYQPGLTSPNYFTAFVRAKHDARWLYLSFRISLESPLPGITASIAYFWGAKIGGNFEHSDMGTVNGSATDDFFGLKDGVWRRDTDYGGQNNVEGTAGYLWPGVEVSLRQTGRACCTFEFRKELDSGDGFDWSLSPGLTYYMQIELSNIDVPLWTFHGSISQYVTLNMLDRPIGTTTTTGITATGFLTTAQASALSAGALFGSLTMLGIVAAVASASWVLVLVRRKKTFGLVKALKRPSAEAVAASGGPSIPTGYADLDSYLGGGLPDGYSVVLVSPSYDERDLLVRRFIKTGLASGRPTLYISADMSRVKDITGRYPEGFYGFFAGQAKDVPQNLNVIAGVESLSDFNIAFNTSKFMTEMRTKTDTTKIVILDILSDVLLRHKALTTRKWLSEFVAKRKTEGFTILGVIDPSISPKDEIQSILSLFDGVIEIFEKELAERARRFVVIKKLYGRLYNESELLLDKGKLF